MEGRNDMIIGNIRFDNGVCSLDYRIYYEDTDTAGVVYYGNYFRYFEWGRTEYLRKLKLPLHRYIKDDILFVAAEASAKYRSPAHYNDVLTLETAVSELRRCSLMFHHTVSNKEKNKLICTGNVKLVSVNDNGKPIAVPEDLKESVLKYVKTK